MKISRLIIVLTLFACTSILFFGCAYTHVQRPLDMNYMNTSLGTKTGESHNNSILWLVAWGDGGTRAAAENGDIEVITHADIETRLILFGLYVRVTTIVYGY